MDFSIEWLREPEAERAAGDLLCGLVRDIRLILMQPGLGSAAKLAAITETVDLLSREPGSAEATAARSAAIVVALLARHAGPATLLLEELAGEQVRIELTGRTDRLLTAAECHELHVAPNTFGHHRTGRLRTAGSGLVAAEVSSIVVPWRVPACARTALGIPGPGERTPPPSDVPLGKALAGLGVRREPLGARLARDGAREQDGADSKDAAHADSASGRCRADGRNSADKASAGEASAGERTRADGENSADGENGAGWPPADRVAVESSARMWLGDVPVALASERVTAALCDRAAPRLARVSSAPQGAREGEC
jgi:hypothetical protein